MENQMEYQIQSQHAENVASKDVDQSKQTDKQRDRPLDHTSNSIEDSKLTEKGDANSKITNKTYKAEDKGVKDTKNTNFGQTNQFNTLMTHENLQPGTELIEEEGTKNIKLGASDDNLVINEDKKAGVVFDSDKNKLNPILGDHDPSAIITLDQVLGTDMKARSSDANKPKLGSNKSSPNKLSPVKKNSKSGSSSEEEKIDVKSPENNKKVDDGTEEKELLEGREDLHSFRVKLFEEVKAKYNIKYLNQENSPNVFFYLNKMKSKPNGEYLGVMLRDWKGDYETLEDNHSYIQWLFPNFYQSAFNSSAEKLEKHEAEIFRHDKEIAGNLVEAYELILDFFGMKMLDRTTGELGRSENFKKRYKDAFCTYFHNHLRMRRILTHLNNVGFRRYAISLIRFLEVEIYGKTGGYKEFDEKEKKYRKLEVFDKAPLKKIADTHGAFMVWYIYGDYMHKPNSLLALQKNCFAKYPEEFQDSVFFEPTTASRDPKDLQIVQEKEPEIKGAEGIEKEKLDLNKDDNVAA